MPITVIVREFATFADKTPFHTFSLFCYGEKDLENLITNYADNFYTAIVETDPAEPGARTFNAYGYNTLARF